MGKEKGLVGFGWGLVEVNLLVGLCVGLAGNNGVTLVAGQIANQRRLKWESSRDGPKEANCLGCITQSGALARKHPEFAAFEDMAVGGWDVVPTGLGDALTLTPDPNP